MAKAIPYFSFEQKTDELIVRFKNLTSGDAVDSWLWDFGGNALPPTSVLKDPPDIEFNAPGIYEVKLSATNADGTASFTFLIVLKETPSLLLTILEMVLVDLPISIPITKIGFDHLQRKWQLMLGKSWGMLPEDYFDELKWDSVRNQLIAKLIVYDLLLSFARTNISGGSTSTVSTTVGSTQLLSDYSISALSYYPLTIISLMVNDIVIPGPVDPFTNFGDVLAWFNSLAKGTFIEDPDLAEGLLSKKNPNLITQFIYLIDGEPENTITNFVQSNQILATTQSGGSIPGQSGSMATGKGPVKSIETGPSKAEWYDGGKYWMDMFEAGGLIEQMRLDICTYANYVGMRLAFCPVIKSTKVFIVGKKRRQC